MIIHKTYLLHIQTHHKCIHIEDMTSASTSSSSNHVHAHGPKLAVRVGVSRRPRLPVPSSGDARRCRAIGEVEPLAEPPSGAMIRSCASARDGLGEAEARPKGPTFLSILCPTCLSKNLATCEAYESGNKWFGKELTRVPP